MSKRKNNDEVTKVFDAFENIASMDEYEDVLDVTMDELNDIERKIAQAEQWLLLQAKNLDKKVSATNDHKAAVEQRLIQLADDYVYTYNKLLKAGQLRGSRMTKAKSLGKKFEYLVKKNGATDKMLQEVQQEAAKEAADVTKLMKKQQDRIDKLVEAKKAEAKNYTTAVDKEVVKMQQAAKKAEADLRRADAQMEKASDKVNKALQNIMVNARHLHNNRQGSATTSTTNKGGISFDKNGLYFDFPTLQGKKGSNVYDSLHASGGKIAKQVEDEFKKIFAGLSKDQQGATAKTMLRGYANGKAGSLTEALIKQGFFKNLAIGGTGTTPFDINGSRVHGTTVNGLYAKDFAKIFSKDPKLAQDLVRGIKIPDSF